MKITICCSLAFSKEAIQIKERLEQSGHEVEIPITILECKEKGIDDIKQWIREFIERDSAGFNELKKERMQYHLQKIVESDSILVLNYKKGEIDNYVGGNTLIEMGLASWFKKKIFLLNEIPAMDYTEEINGLVPIVLRGNLDLIK